MADFVADFEKNFKQKSDLIKSRRSMSVSNVLDYACQKGWTDVLNWMDSNNLIPMRTNIMMDFSHINVSILDWFHNNPKYRFFDTKLYMKKIRVDLLEWFHAHPEYKLQFNRGNVVNYASIFDDCHILEWFHNHPEYKTHRSGRNILKYRHDAINLACQYGSVKVIQWWFDHREIYGFEYTEKSIHNACKYNKIEVLDWFFGHTEELEKYGGFLYNELAINYAIMFGHVDVLEWFHRHVEDLNEVGGFKFTKCSVRYAIRHKNMASIEWLKKHDNYYGSNSAVRKLLDSL